VATFLHSTRIGGTVWIIIVHICGSRIGWSQVYMRVAGEEVVEQGVSVGVSFQNLRSYVVTVLTL